MKTLLMLLIAGLLLAAPAGDSHAESVVAAEWHPDETLSSYNTWRAFGYTTGRAYEGRSFLCTVTGALQSIELCVYRGSGEARTLNAWLYAMNGDLPTGNPLDTTSAPAASLGAGESGMVSFWFAADETILQAGESYALVISPSLLFDGPEYGFRGLFQDLYPDGHDVYRNADSGWFHQTMMEIPVRVVVDDAVTGNESRAFGAVKALYR